MNNLDKHVKTEGLTKLKSTYSPSNQSDHAHGM